VGLVGAGVSLVIGVLWGAVAGYVGGRVDSVMMRIVDILYSLPSIIFVIVLITTLEGLLKHWLAAIGSSSFAQSGRLLFLLIGLGAVSWLNMARIVRGQVLSLRQRPFVEASRALGAGPLRILARHIVPSTLGVIIVYVSLTVPAIVLSRTPGFQLHWIWYLSVAAVFVQLALSMFLLRREFNRRLVFPARPKLDDNTAVASAMVAAE